MRESNKLTKILERPGPNLAASFSDRIGAQEISDIQKKGLDIAEIRIDLYQDFKPEMADDFRDIANIATIRAKNEGGNWSGSEQERLKLFKDIMPKIDAVDIESSATGIIDEVIAEAKKHDVLAMVSYHNFKDTPDISELENIISAATAKGADIIKIATQVNSQADIEKLAALLQGSDKKLVVIGMGDMGSITRVTFPRYGSLLTFCQLNKQTAPGQMSLEKMVAELSRCYQEYGKRSE